MSSIILLNYRYLNPEHLNPNTVFTTFLYFLQVIMQVTCKLLMLTDCVSCVCLLLFTNWSLFLSVLSHTLQLLAQTKAMMDETKQQVNAVFQLLSSGTQSHDFSDTMNHLKKMETEEEIKRFFCRKLEDRSFRKQKWYVCF